MIAPVRVGLGDPTLIVVPLFGLNDRGTPLQFLGTGLFTGREPHLLTCDHVLRQWPGPVGIALTSRGNAIFLGTPLLRDEVRDLAILRVPGYVPQNVFPFFTGDYPENFPVISLDYAGSATVGGELQILINTRHGGIIRRHRQFDRLGDVGARALELSFPALSGASGAPVLAPSIFVALGLVRDNVTHVLNHTQLEPMFDQANNRVEHGEYPLPAALAIDASHLQAFFRRAGLDA